MTMITRSYTVSFLTPAFLGDAEQNGAWRTPPFKALLRQWWRVAYAVGRNADMNLVAQMRRDEGLLFGVAADMEGESRQSQIRIRLSKWDGGKLKNWDGLEQPKVHHPETERTQYKVGPHAYIGYGPLDGRGNTTLKRKAAIRSGDTAELKLAFPDECSKTLDTALCLMDRYGTLGGRSRNGWGSFSLTPTSDTPRIQVVLDGGLVRDWKDAVKLDWPHCIGTFDDTPLIWETGPMANWEAVMKRLAELKIGLRTQFVFTTGRNAPHPESRHWLSYPVTNHTVDGWKEHGKGDFRLPNSLRFKVRQGADGKLHGVIFHVPCLPPEQFRPSWEAIVSVWQSVHRLLDELCKPLANRQYAIADAQRLASLKPSLDALSLNRIPV